jgi:hypothetical protein
MGSLAAVFLISVAGVTSLGREAYSSSAMANWVQAVGSIGAIFGAVWLATAQSRTVRQEKQVAIFAVVHAAVVEARRFRDYLGTADPEQDLYLSYHRSIVDSYFGALSSCPVHELHSPIAVTAHLRLRDQLPFLRDSIEACIAGPAKHPKWKAEFDALDGALMSDEKLRLWEERTEQKRNVLRRNVEVHIDAIEKRYGEMASALGDVRVG